MPALTRSVRLRRGAILLAGAVAYAALVEGPLGFVWTALLLGLAYLAAAAAGGPRGGLWATGCALTGWGLGEVLVGEGVVETSRAAAAVAGAGAGVLATALLARRGFAADPAGAGAALLAAGLVYALAPHVALVTEPWPYAALLALVGAVNLALAARAPRTGSPGSRGATAGRPTSPGPQDRVA